MTDPLLQAVDDRIAAALVGPLARLSAIEARLGPVPVLPVPPAPAASRPATLHMGIGLLRPSYWTPAVPFNDLTKTTGGGSTPWMEAQVPLDADGWPVSLASGQRVATVLMQGPHFPAGPYAILWDGEGTVELSGDATTTLTISGASVPIVPATQVTLRVTRSTAGKPLRNLRVLAPGANAAAIIRDAFVAGLQPFSVLRFMDWSDTNNSAQVNWPERPTLSQRTWINGIPWEAMVDVANAVGADPWLCIPRLASLDYTRALCSLVKGRLRAGRQVYVEFWNEFWNKGQSADTQPAAYAKRAVEHFGVVRDVLGATAVRVLSGQAGNPDVGRQVLAAVPRGSCDALAIGAYFGHRIGSDATVATWPVDKVLDAALADIPAERALWAGSKAVADAAGVPLVAYEGGPHLVGVGALAGPLAPKLIEASRHPRMVELLAACFSAWEGIGGGLFNYYAHVSVPGPSGSWGAREWHDQAGAPKDVALRAAAATWKARA